ncbi:hypothetical protein BJY00DRAFT_253917 [Aspergillus carlsbadensis]|nr:hypothetical protein BJY00DRAFT_253917 [Aspergillus carlsbadensis]
MPVKIFKAFLDHSPGRGLLGDKDWFTPGSGSESSHRVRWSTPASESSLLYTRQPISHRVMVSSEISHREDHLHGLVISFSPIIEPYSTSSTLGAYEPYTAQHLCAPRAKSECKALNDASGIIVIQSGPDRRSHVDIAEGPRSSGLAGDGDGDGFTVRPLISFLLRNAARLEGA